MSTKKDPFEGYVPHGPEWKAYMMKQPKALCIEVATGIADERDKLKAINKELLEALRNCYDVSAGVSLHQALLKAQELCTRLDKK